MLLVPSLVAWPGYSHRSSVQRPLRYSHVHSAVCSFLLAQPDLWVLRWLTREEGRRGEGEERRWGALGRGYNAACLLLGSP